MELAIVGIVHFDPLGKTRLSKCLSDLNEEKNIEPEFVAVEWDRDIFLRIVQQRDLMRHLAEGEWPEAAPILLDTISESLGYEGDTHGEIFPSTQTIWLDEGRGIPNSSVIENYAEDRMKLYRDLSNTKATKFDYDSLINISIASWERSNKNASGTERDKTLAAKLTEVVGVSNPGWAVVIVGANHADHTNGNMSDLLASRGISCKSHILSPSK